jgi:predicted secreted hydrolase
MPPTEPRLTTRATCVRSAWLLTTALLAAHPVAQSADRTDRKAGGFMTARPGYQYHFPQDHASHDRFRTEWWYYTGHLKAESRREFGFQLTFFRRGVDHETARTNPSRWTIRNLYLAHLALSDIDGGRYRYAEKISRAGLGKAGAEAERLHVWIDRWTLEADETGQRQQLHAQAAEFGIDLALSPMKPPIVHGERGVSRKGSGASDASHYYSLTRVATEGTLRLSGDQFHVSGTTWMDHEFGSGDLPDDLVGWDWFSVQLDDGRELMLYLLRRPNGLPHPASSGTLIVQEGRSQHLPVSAFSVEVLDHWTSPHSETRYPSRWRLSVPEFGLDLEITPRLPDQELRTTRSTQVTYWEGAVGVRGRSDGQAVNGQGYVELTGYAKRFQH